MSADTAYPVRKALSFTAEQWERVRAFRFDQRVETEAEAVRRLIDLGLEASTQNAPQPATSARKPRARAGWDKQ